MRIRAVPSLAAIGGNVADGVGITTAISATEVPEGVSTISAISARSAISSVRTRRPDQISQPSRLVPDEAIGHGHFIGRCAVGPIGAISAISAVSTISTGSANDLARVNPRQRLRIDPEVPAAFVNHPSVANFLPA